jgi:hypothetical protein
MLSRPTPAIIKVFEATVQSKSAQACVPGNIFKLFVVEMQSLQPDPHLRRRLCKDRACIHGIFDLLYSLVSRRAGSRFTRINGTVALTDLLDMMSGYLSVVGLLGRAPRFLTRGGVIGTDSADCRIDRLSKRLLASDTFERSSALVPEISKCLLEDLVVKVYGKIAGPRRRDGSGVAMRFVSKPLLIIGLSGKSGLEQLIEPDSRDTVLHGVLLSLQVAFISA